METCALPLTATYQLLKGSNAPWSTDDTVALVPVTSGCIYVYVYVYPLIRMLNLSPLYDAILLLCIWPEMGKYTPPFLGTCLQIDSNVGRQEICRRKHKPRNVLPEQRLGWGRGQYHGLPSTAGWPGFMHPSRYLSDDRTLLMIVIVSGRKQLSRPQRSSVFLTNTTCLGTLQDVGPNNADIRGF